MKTFQLSPRPRRRGKVLGIALVVVLAIGLGTYGFFGEELGMRESAVQPVRGQLARRGDLKITVVEGGNLSAANSTDLASEIEGRTTILYLIEEGVIVEEGDLLVELDVSALMDRQVQQEINVQSARAAFVKAEQNYEIQKSTNESNIARALREHEFAIVDLEKYLDGDWPQQLQGAAESITLAQEELKRAEDDLEWSEKLAAKGFLEATQLERDRLAATGARIRLDQATRAKQLLERYEYPRQKKEFEANVEEKQRELERQELEAAAKLVDFEANLASAKAKRTLEEDEFDELLEQIEKAKIRAPVAGMVVYAVENSGRGRDDPMAEGTEVRERQKIITIPSSEGMVAEVSLHESVLEKVKTGMSCALSVDAVPDRRFAGRVKFKAILPDKNSWWANPDLRVYRTEITVLDSDPRLRPGMTCSVEILVDTLRDVVHVPVQSVFLDGHDTVCFVASDRDKGRNGVEKRVVEVGQNDGKWVHIVSGIEAGEEVLLSQPEGFSLEAAQLQEDEVMDDAPGDGPAPGGDPAGRGAAAAPRGESGSLGGEKPARGARRGGRPADSAKAKTDATTPAQN
ncbi:MAG: efflux RND transporter periplasmic adaptor subunit [Planctomycetota bacterium]